jgi:hypothetical protein
VLDKKKQEEVNLLGFQRNSKTGAKVEEIKFRDSEAMDFGW